MLAVVVALLSGWLAISMAEQPRVSMKPVIESPVPAPAPAVQSQPKAKDKTSDVMTSVTIPSTEVQTSVKIVPKK